MGKWSILLFPSSIYLSLLLNPQSFTSAFYIINTQLLFFPSPLAHITSSFLLPVLLLLVRVYRAAAQPLGQTLSSVSWERTTALISTLDTHNTFSSLLHTQTRFAKWHFTSIEIFCLAVRAAVHMWVHTIDRLIFFYFLSLLYQKYDWRSMCCGLYMYLQSQNALFVLTSWVENHAANWAQLLICIKHLNVSSLSLQRGHKVLSLQFI